MAKITIPAGKFKAECLQLMNKVQEHQVSYVISKHGKPIAKLAPLGNEKMTDPFGCMKGTITIFGNIIEPIDTEWESNQ